MYPEPEWKQRMNVKVSAAEHSVFSALSQRGLTKNIMTQNPICLKQCIPDFMWPDLRMIVFLDGEQIHNKPNRQRKDREIDWLLTKRGWKVLRISYHAPITKGRLKEIVNDIEAFLRTHEKFSSVINKR